jgi:FMN reductase
MPASSRASSGGDAALPLVLGLGGSVGANSATEQALRVALAGAQRAGVRTLLIGAEDILALPMYGGPGSKESEVALRLVANVREARGLIFASPGYHGTVSGAVKNAVDYIQETWADERPYLSDIPVGLIAVAGGHQAAMSTLVTLRAITHALRGWPTPLGVALNSQAAPIVNQACQDPVIHSQLELVGRQVADFILRRLPLVA